MLTNHSSSGAFLYDIRGKVVVSGSRPRHNHSSRISPASGDASKGGRSTRRMDGNRDSFSDKSVSARSSSRRLEPRWVTTRAPGTRRSAADQRGASATICRVSPAVHRHRRRRTATRPNIRTQTPVARPDGRAAKVRGPGLEDLAFPSATAQVSSAPLTSASGFPAPASPERHSRFATSPYVTSCSPATIWTFVVRSSLQPRRRGLRRRVASRAGSRSRHFDNRVYRRVTPASPATSLSPERLDLTRQARVERHRARTPRRCRGRAGLEADRAGLITFETVDRPRRPWLGTDCRPRPASSIPLRASSRRRGTARRRHARQVGFVIGDPQVIDLYRTQDRPGRYQCGMKIKSGFQWSSTTGPPSRCRLIPDRHLLK